MTSKSWFKKIDKKKQGIFLIYICIHTWLLKLNLWTHSGSVLPVSSVDIFKHNLTLFLLKTTGETLGSIILCVAVKHWSYICILIVGNWFTRDNYAWLFLTCPNMYIFGCLRFLRCILLLYDWLIFLLRLQHLYHQLRGW